MTKIVCLRWLTFDILLVKQIFKIRVVFHTLYLWNEVGDPQEGGMGGGGGGSEHRNTAKKI